MHSGANACSVANWNSFLFYKDNVCLHATMNANIFRLRNMVTKDVCFHFYCYLEVALHAERKLSL